MNNIKNDRLVAFGGISETPDPPQPTAVRHTFFRSRELRQGGYYQGPHRSAGAWMTVDKTRASNVRANFEPETPTDVDHKGLDLGSCWNSSSVQLGQSCPLSALRIGADTHPQMGAGMAAFLRAITSWHICDLTSPLNMGALTGKQLRGFEWLTSEEVMRSSERIERTRNQY
ncbi:uncharacterized protein BKA78DRAFT_154387 [Phyllosticta capitalensis]|uniref:uncharacterized protein n=1 Tax=Phyllosticta capitalensis TaxID=121624 RepID=UPI003130B4AA